MAVDGGLVPIMGLLDEVIEFVIVAVVGLRGVMPACGESWGVVLWLGFDPDFGEVAEG